MSRTPRTSILLPVFDAGDTLHLCLHSIARQTDPDCQVVVISGYSTLFSVSESAKSGASAFLSKPFSISDLKRAVTECIEQ